MIDCESFNLEYFQAHREGPMKPIPEMTKDEIIRELCERLGLCWHEPGKRGRFTRICQKCGKIGNLHYYNLRYRNFYSDPGKVILLREMMKLTNAAAFKVYLWRKAGWLTSDNHEQFMMTFAIPYCYLNGQNDLLPTTTLDWLRKVQGK